MQYIGHGTTAIPHRDSQAETACSANCPEPPELLSTWQKKIFIDGQYGTAGLLLASLVDSCPHLTLATINYEQRRDEQARTSQINSADLVVLCLPAGAAREVSSQLPANTPVLDCSSAHRCSADWTYGLPELSGDQRDCIARAHRVSNAGCFASAFLLLTRPLVDSGLLEPGTPLAVTGVTGYSAGGRRMISRYENSETTESTAVHGLNLNHKHLPEMQKYAGLDVQPVFTPVVGNHREGLFVSVLIPYTVHVGQIMEVYAKRYGQEAFIQLNHRPSQQLNVTYPAKNTVDIYAHGRGDSTIVFAQMNNLMKGAAGTALQNINLMLGHNECDGLI